MSTDRCICGYASADRSNMTRHKRTCRIARIPVNELSGWVDQTIGNVSGEAIVRTRAITAGTQTVDAGTQTVDAGTQTVDAVELCATTDAAVALLQAEVASLHAEVAKQRARADAAEAEQRELKAHVATKFAYEGSVQKEAKNGLPLGHPETMAYDWMEIKKIASHLVRDERVEYLDASLRNVLAVLPVGGWADAKFDLRTVVRMYHAMASGPHDEVTTNGPRRACLHDVEDGCNTSIEDAWGAADHVKKLHMDEGGMFTYTVQFCDRVRRVRCGHDLQEYPRALKREIRSYWKGDLYCPTMPHYLGDMSLDVTGTMRAAASPPCTYARTQPPCTMRWRGPRSPGPA
jgi:uncharacterized small protein (DUF1192 family)